MPEVVVEGSSGEEEGVDMKVGFCVHLNTHKRCLKLI